MSKHIADTKNKSYAFIVCLFYATKRTKHKNIFNCGWYLFADYIKIYVCIIVFSFHFKYLSVCWITVEIFYDRMAKVLPFYHNMQMVSNVSIIFFRYRNQSYFYNTWEINTMWHRFTLNTPFPVFSWIVISLEHYQKDK